ncbi:MAG: hypothetical protein WCW44_04255 [archaeon]|jgi:hypothetical protein
MKGNILNNSLLLRRLSELKEASEKRKEVRVEAVELAKRVPSIVAASRIARKGTLRLRDDVLAGPEIQNGSARERIKQLNTILEYPIPSLERKLVAQEVQKWEEQLKNAQKRLKRTE